MSMDKFKNLLHTNYVPTDEEVLSIQHHISEPSLRISKLDDEIAAAEALINDLRQTQAGLIIGIHEYRALLSPFRRLPPDLLREIFLHCLLHDRNPTMSASEAPTLLTRVSSEWRDVAFTTPRLWAALHIPVPNPPTNSTMPRDHVSGKRISLESIAEVRLAATEEWIQRSGSLPLSFSLHEHDRYPPTGFGKRFVQRILPYRARWRSIELVCLASSFLEIHDLAPSEVPMLESLSLVVSRASRSGANGTQWKDMPIFQAPTLRKVLLSGISWDMSQFCLPWEQLTELGIEGDTSTISAVASVDEIISALGQCPNLVSCSLHISQGASVSRRDRFPKIPLPHLESLTIFDGLLTSQIYNSIDAPKLRKLSYTGGREILSSPDPTPSALHQLLARVGGSLEELVVTSAAFQGVEEVISSLALLPALKVLSIVSSPLFPPASGEEDRPGTFIDGLLESLAHTSDTAPHVCPKLEVFRCMGEAYFSDDALGSFIWRKQSGEAHGLAPLKEVSVVFTRRPTVDLQALLAPHVAAGLRLGLQYPPRRYRGALSLYDGLPDVAGLDPFATPY